MAGVAINLWWICSLPIFGLCPTQTQKNEVNKIIERFVWRLDCRLKYIFYLLLTKFVIFGYFWGKMRLFLGSLWRALQLTSDEARILFFFLFCYHKKQKRKECVWDREVCVTVGLSSEGYLLPIVKSWKVMIFDYFWGKMRLFLGSLWRALQRDINYPCDCCVLFCGFIATQ